MHPQEIFCNFEMPNTDSRKRRVISKQIKILPYFKETVVLNYKHCSVYRNTFRLL